MTTVREIRAFSSARPIFSSSKEDQIIGLFLIFVRSLTSNQVNKGLKDNVGFYTASGNQKLAR